MKEGRTIKIILLFILIIILVSIILFGIWYYYNHKEQNPQLELPNYENKFDKIKILYDYGSIMVFSDTYESEEENAFEINVEGESLVELQNMLINYNIESDKYKIEETGHYHGSTFYGGIVIIPADYKVIFNDGSEMIIDERDYQIQYKNKDTYYKINDGKEIAQKIIKIVDEKLHENIIKVNTKTISIKGLTSGNTLNITDQKTILKILNEFIYAKDAVMTENLYKRLIEAEKDDYDNNRKISRELEYRIDFNNGTIIKVSLRNGNVGCISDKNNNFIEGIKINSKFISIIHNIFTDYYKEKDKLFEADEIYIQHDNIERTLSNSEKTEFLNKLLMIEIDGDKITEDLPASINNYILEINNNKIFLDQNSLYIVYANGEGSYIYSLDLQDYIKNLIN